MADSSQLDALVVGAGPTGLAMTGDLLRHGMSARLIDKADQPTTLSKAVVVMPRTLEEFAPRGLAQESIARGEPSIGLSTFHNGHLIFHSVYDDLATDYSFLINTPQADTEAVLRGYVSKHGGTPEWSTELLEFEESDEGVAATLRKPDGSTEEVRAHYLIGCDGAHSTARHGLDIQFQGDRYPENWLLADVQIDWRLPHGHTYLFFEENGLLAVFPMPENRVRLYVVEPDKEAHGRNPTLEEMQAMIDRFVPGGGRLFDARWLSEFRCHHRKAERYSRGRIFLAGDAAHIHSPETGLGMNTGIQDAFNLAWKIAAVRKGWSPADLLDTYHAERNEVGKQILKLSDQTHKIWAQFGWLAEAIREPMWKFFSNYYAHHSDKLEEAVQIRIHYPGNPYLLQQGKPEHTHDTMPPPQVGMRAINGPIQALDGRPEDGTTLHDLLDAGLHRLIFFAGAHPDNDQLQTLRKGIERIADYRDKVEPLVIVGGQDGSACADLGVPVYVDPSLLLHLRYAAQKGALFLLRPDLYFGYVSHNLDPAPLEAYLSKLFPSS